MDKIGFEMGRNLRKVRTALGFTLQDVADMLDAIDCPMSVQSLSMIESGKRRAYADQIYRICQVMGVSPMTVIPSDNLALDDSVSAGVRSLSAEEKEIIHYCFTKWYGNSTALIKFMGLYMSLPMQLRNMVSGMGIAIYQYADKTNQVDHSAPGVDIEYIIEGYRRLFN